MVPPEWILLQVIPWKKFLWEWIPMERRSAGWVQDQNGWWYKNEDGTYPVGKWNMIGDKWYLFDMNGYMLTGWQWKNDREYYLTSNGDMVTGWFQYNRIWYYLDPRPVFL